MRDPKAHIATDKARRKRKLARTFFSRPLILPSTAVARVAAASVVFLSPSVLALATAAT